MVGQPAWRTIQLSSTTMTAFEEPWPPAPCSTAIMAWRTKNLAARWLASSQPPATSRATLEDMATSLSLAWLGFMKSAAAKPRRASQPSLATSRAAAAGRRSQLACYWLYLHGEEENISSINGWRRLYQKPSACGLRRMKKAANEAAKLKSA